MEKSFFAVAENGVKSTQNAPYPTNLRPNPFHQFLSLPLGPKNWVLLPSDRLLEKNFKSGSGTRYGLKTRYLAVCGTESSPASDLSFGFLTRGSRTKYSSAFGMDQRTKIRKVHKNLLGSKMRTNKFGGGGHVPMPMPTREHPFVPFPSVLSVHPVEVVIVPSLCGRRTPSVPLPLCHSKCN